MSTSPRSTSHSKFASHSVVLLAAAGSAVFLWGVWGSEFPLGIPGEWAWPRVASNESLAWRLSLPLVAALLYAGFVALGLRQIAEVARPARALWLLGLSGAGFFWLWVVQQGAPTGYDLTKSAWVLYYPKSSGYFTTARKHHQSFADFLANYEETVAAGDVLHQGTHPPGLIIAFELLLRLVESSPPLQSALLATEPETVDAAFREVQLLSTRTDGNLLESLPLTPVDRGVLWLAFLLVQGGAAVVVLPLYGLVRRNVSVQSAWLAAAFWPTVPALALFIPKSDALFPLASCLVLLAWLNGVDRRGPSAALWGLLAGVLLWIALLLSLAPLVIGFWGVVATVFVCRSANRDAAGTDWIKRESIRLIPATLGLTLGLVLPTVLFSLSTQCSLPAVWWGNYQNHAGFYEQYPRTWWKWLLANPVELTVAAGIPLTCAAAAAVAHQFRTATRSTATVSFCVTWGLLLFSGKNMGEAARLWLFLMPGLCWIAGDWFESQGAAPIERNSTNRQWAALVLLILQLIFCTAIVTRVGGFEY